MNTNGLVVEAMEFAYRSEGVRNFTNLGGMFASPVQHSAARAKAIKDKAQAYLSRKNSTATLTILRSNSGQVMHVISQA